MKRILFTILGLFVTGAGQAAEPAISKADAEFFTKQILPILKADCYQCHSHEANKSKGGLVLDSKEGLLKGGSTGPAVVPKDLSKSLLIKAVHYKNPDFAMPPDGKLPANKVALLEDWVRRGAPDPRVLKKSVPSSEDIAAKAKTHWSFQPVKKPVVPAIVDPWIRTPIDAFILAKLKEKGMVPNAMADRQTLIRRLAFDLTGLPPAPEDVDEFLADNAPKAYEKLVDKYLASPQYGERWGRHWLDVARYSDTFGERSLRNSEIRFPFAYTYRDYVIESFNADKPYNQFLIEQLAADKLPEAQKDVKLQTALGFLTVGKRFVVPDDITDDRIDVVTRGLMGLSVNCARCHDHKFDPIPTKDYYSLFGVFTSSYEPSLPPVIQPAKEGPLYQEYLKKLAEANAELQDFDDKHWSAWEQKAAHKMAEYLMAIKAVRDNATDGLTVPNFVRQKELSPAVAARWRQIIQQAARKQDSIASPLLAFLVVSDADVAVKYPGLIAQMAKGGSKEKPVHPLVAKAFRNASPKSFKEVAGIYGKLFADADDAWRKLTAENKNAKELPDKDMEGVRKFLLGWDGVLDHTNMTFAAEHGLREDTFRNRIKKGINDVMMYHEAAPVRAMVLNDDPNPKDSPIFVRGERANRGPLAPRQFLEILSGPNRKPFKEGSGRLELAQAIASKDNPLTARVMVNRIWLNHFGQGIVTTPSDFGLRGEAPSNPELLDFLASRFMNSGWSMKKLHRLIVLSSVYRQKSDPNPAYADKDPTNAYLAHMNRHRLEFEAMRDSILSVSGALDRTLGGRSVDGLRTVANRRTVYSIIDRFELPGTFITFDFASPEMTSPQRFQTTVPQQALFLMNSPFVIEHSKQIVASKEFLALPNDEARLAELYRRLFQRKPTKEDLADGLAFLQAQTELADEHSSVTAWQYGFGGYDPQEKKIRRFIAYPKFVDNQYFVNSSAKQDAGKAALTPEGGQAGKVRSFSAIRRWVAPFDGEIAIDATLTTASKTGLRGYIVSSRLGELGRHAVKDGKAETPLKKVPVKKGDTIDFIVESADKVETAFAWSPKIIRIEAVGEEMSSDHDWSAKDDFHGPVEAVKGMTPWEKYAQVLLLTNEFVYVN